MFQRQDVKVPVCFSGEMIFPNASDYLSRPAREVHCFMAVECKQPLGLQGRQLHRSFHPCSFRLSVRQCRFRTILYDRMMNENPSTVSFLRSPRPYLLARGASTTTSNKQHHMAPAMIKSIFISCMRRGRLSQVITTDAGYY